MSVVGTSWYSTILQNIVCYYCWQWRAETKPKEDIFLKPYCSSQSGPGSLCSLASSKVARMNYITQTCQSWAMRGEQVSNLNQAWKCCYFSTRSFRFLPLPSCSSCHILKLKKIPNQTKPNQTKLKKSKKNPTKKTPNQRKWKPSKALTQKGEGSSFFSHFSGQK